MNKHSRKIKKQLMLLGCFFVFEFCSAQTELENLLQISQQQHPIWLAREYQARAKQGQIGVLKNTTLPNIEASYQFNFATTNNITGMYFGQGFLPISGPPSEKNHYAPNTGSAIGLISTWSPVTFGLLDAKIKVTEQELLAYNSETQHQLLHYQTQIVQQYLEVVRYQSLKSINSNNLSRLAKMQILVRDLVKNGLKPEGDIALIQSEITRNQIEYTNYEGQIQRGKIKLAELVGQNTIEVNDTAWLLQIPSIFSEYPSVASHPAEQLAIRVNDIEKARLSVIQKNYLPKLTLFGLTFARGSGVNEAFFTGFGLQRFNYGVGAHLSVPIIKGTEKNILMNQQSLRIKATTEQINVIHTSLQQQAKVAQSLLDESIQIATQMPFLFSETQKVFTTSQERYQRGLINLNEVIQAQYQLQKVELEQRLATLNVWQALLLKANVKGDLTIFFNNKN